TVGHETQAIVDGPGRVEAFTTVGKGIGRHIDDRHHTRAIQLDTAEAAAQTRPLHTGLRLGIAVRRRTAAGRHRRAAAAIRAGARPAGVVAHDRLAAQDLADLV